MTILGYEVSQEVINYTVAGVFIIVACILGHGNKGDGGWGDGGGDGGDGGD
jgi:hypothetical protein